MAIEFPEPLFRTFRAVYKIVDDPSTDSEISWSKSNNSFIIWDSKEFEAKVLSRYAVSLGRRFPIFLFELKTFGFKRVRGSEHRWEFGDKHGCFVRGRPDLLKKMQVRFLAKRTRKAMAIMAREDALAPRMDNLRIT